MTETMDLNKDFSDDDGDIIELTDILEDLPDDGDDSGELSGTKAAARDAAAFSHGVPDDEAIEAALLRIVEKKYAHRLDALFVEAVERVVEREIAAIKQSLLKDLS
ncbi:hypothetical protein HRM2_20890 [Desulforapulum autotrophicum HRM2]|uniref:Uncharacterized protein n=1 Tax=Desulforapulum autotrophicum (strain ATCC 43914 / DSM 3382 / VKM B-1955 / HRM2) TaxID=177437 RepID=C0QDC3_DESAH|nr:hypothetical protein [Desulforapulum autotrophicum]ACN15187.1 hypothetical protein HRM2_20890 [Desulforapulum autotrophicum HRM2]